MPQRRLHLMYKEIQRDSIEPMCQSEGPMEVDVDQRNPSEAQATLPTPPSSKCANSTLNETPSPRTPVDTSNRASYASVLKYSPTAPRSANPSSTSRPPSPSPSNSSASSVQSLRMKRVLSMEDLQLRFKNKPSPLHAQHTHISSSTNNLDSSTQATRSLTKFLTTALPAFAKFLEDF